MGERVMRPDFGCKINDLISSPLSLANGKNTQDAAYFK
jgi:phage baseplate assembly protein W